MQRNCLVTFVYSIAVLIIGFTCESKPAAVEQTEVLKITVGESTKLSSDRTSPEVAVSRTGTVAAFFGIFYRISTDGGPVLGPGDGFSLRRSRPYVNRPA